MELSAHNNFQFSLTFLIFLDASRLEIVFHFFRSCCNHHRSQSTLHRFLTDINNSLSDNEHDGVSFPFHFCVSSSPPIQLLSFHHYCRVAAAKWKFSSLSLLSTIWRHNKRRVEIYRKTAEVSVKSIMNFPTMLDDASALKQNLLACWKPPLSTMETLHVISANESNFNVEAACSRVRPLAWQLSYGEVKVFVFNEWRKLSFQCWLVKNGGKSHKSHLTIFLLSPPPSAEHSAPSKAHGSCKELGKRKKMKRTWTFIFVQARRSSDGKFINSAQRKKKCSAKRVWEIHFLVFDASIARCSLPHIECRYRMETLSLHGTGERGKANVIKLITGKMCLRHISSILELFAHPSR